MHKKGDSPLETQLIWAFYIILAIVAYFIISDITSERSFFEDFIVRETGLSIDALHNSPGKTNVYYSNLQDINVKIKENFIEVSSLTKNIPKIYSFTRDKTLTELDYNFNIINNSTLKISKEKNIYLELKNE
ncbi:MAG: hypothetical protein AABW45_03615 [Nanoarchaeota archaeon]